MKDLISTLKSDRILYQNARITLAVNILCFLVILPLLSKLPPFIPLFNQMPWGEQRIAPTVFIFLPPALSSLIFLVNIAVASFLYKKGALISRLFSVTSLLIAVLVLIFVIKTIRSVI